MKRLLISVLIFSSFSAVSQDYESAIGLRGGLINAITYKWKLNDFSAAESIASLQYRGLVVTGLYTIQNPWNLEGERLQWYYGGGAHVGVLNNYEGHPFLDSSNDGGVIIGVDGVIGAEYTFPSVPINVSLDYKPAFNLIGYTGFWFDGFSLGVRYVLD